MTRVRPQEGDVQSGALRSLGGCQALPAATEPVVSDEGGLLDDMQSCKPVMFVSGRGRPRTEQAEACCQKEFYPNRRSKVRFVAGVDPSPARDRCQALPEHMEAGTDEHGKDDGHGHLLEHDARFAANICSGAGLSPVEQSAGGCPALPAMSEPSLRGEASFPIDTQRRFAGGLGRPRTEQADARCQEEFFPSQWPRARIIAGVGQICRQQLM